jgi:magnesium-transporting ATPase (P-type)
VQKRYGTIHAAPQFLARFRSPRVLRGGDFKIIPTEEVVPGDVVALERGPVTCDLVVLRGGNIILDESALTGETSPVAKHAIDEKTPEIIYNVKNHAAHSLFAGTNIEQAGDGDVALVVSTGSFTVKGALLMDVLAFQRDEPLFKEDVQIVVMLLLAESLIIAVISIAWLGHSDIFFFFDCKCRKSFWLCVPAIKSNDAFL